MPAERVLVVEDEALNRQLMVETLSDAGFQVHQAGTAVEAESLLEADGYHLLVTDVHMPGERSGLELAVRTHRAEPHLPILFVTGRPDVISQLRGSGIRGAVLPKPFALAELVRAARALIGAAHTGAD